MKGGVRKFGAADRRLLPEGRLSGPMPWVIAIMMFLTVLAAAAGLGLGSAATGLDADIGNRLTVQIVEANPDARERQSAAALAALRQTPGVLAATRVSDQQMAALLEPWLGPGGIGQDIPIPALIDVELGPGTTGNSVRDAVRAAAPDARVDDNAQWLAPLAKLIDALQLLAAALVLLMVGALAATVVLAARAALDTHRSTIEVLHLMGATDVQVARLFQRRIALDALFGGVTGFVAAALVLAVIGRRLGALGSDLLGSAGLPILSWLLLLVLPFAGVLLAVLVARVTILKALGRLL
ncbi:cell division protein FtsX [Allosphingosinicella indica]|uniref:Cell division transport system permease protein n=1 Tax=Allosphingosinicella indica TaxID=941907 RepID=A0A1X7G4W2_9SPHN|nr:FtsX-like permease family protein [Allosphingosinicella indica]SMF63979.1 cell division transport system permease protein [Allosphingosinicella indica]